MGATDRGREMVDEFSRLNEVLQEMDADDPRLPEALRLVEEIAVGIDKVRDRNAAQSTPIFPQDLPLLRRRMVAFYDDDLAGIRPEKRTKSLIDSMLQASDGPEDLGLSVTREQRDALVEAELLFVSESMARLLEHGHEGMGEAGFERYDLPADYGLAYLDLDMPLARHSRSESYDYEHGERILFVWRHVPDSDDASPRGRVEVSTYIDKERSGMAALADTSHPVWRGLPRFIWDDTVDIAYGDVAVDRQRLRASRSDGLRQQWWQERRGPMFRALCYLLQQRVTTSTVEQPTRALRKLVKRQGGEPAPIRVIALRGATSGGPATSGDREYVHQWMVRGHWRRQWYGTMKQHRPLFIAPYVKGPEGAPMIGGEKVYRAVAPVSNEVTSS